jgi:sugar phosphate isomerase/epimerase
MPTTQPEFSLAYLAVFGTPPQRMVEIAAETGYDYVSLRLCPVTVDEPRFPFMSDPQFVRSVRESLSRHDMRVLDVELVRVDPGTTARDFIQFLDVAAELGARHVVTQIPEADRAKAVDQFAEICDLAARCDLTADLEFIPWQATSDLAAAADIVTKVGMPNGGILVDTLHFARSESSIAQLRQIPASMFNLVQLCDAPPASSLTTEELIRVARSDRNPPGEGSLDLRSVVDILPSVPYALEVPNDVMREDLGVFEFARRVLNSARTFMNAGSGRDQTEVLG